jgi:hypothetical protein
MPKIIFSASHLDDYEERFWQRVVKDGALMPHMDSHCWGWSGGQTSGYGSVPSASNPKKWIYAHRFSLWLATGDNPVMVCHHCDNRICSNPDHLYAGDALTNAIDRFSRVDLHANPDALKRKINASIVLEIMTRYRNGENTVELGKRFNISNVMVGKIVRGESWKHLTEGFFDAVKTPVT